MNKKLRSGLLSLFIAFTIVAVQLFTGINAYAETNPGVEASVRIETSDKTVLEKTDVNVNGSSPAAYDVITKALDEKGIKYDFPDGSYGKYMKTIDGITGDLKSASWMFTVNDELPAEGIGTQKIKNGDNIVVYYEDNWSMHYAYFDKTSLNAEIGQDIHLNLKGKYYDSNFNEVSASESGVKILVNNSPSSYVTDKDGNVTLNFDKAGTYEISAHGNDSQGEPVSRPYCSIAVTSSKPADKTAPVITTDLKDETVSKSYFTFNVSANDDVDGNIEPSVIFNGSKVNPGSDGKYAVSLLSGNNTIHIEASDNSSNKSSKDFAIIYNEPCSSYDINGEMNSTLNYIKKNNIDEWSALSLSKFGILGNADTFNKIVESFKSGVKENGIENYFSSNTDLEKMIIYVTSQGYNPYNFCGYDLVKELYNRGNDGFTGYNIYASIFGIFAVDYANIDDKNYNINKEELKDDIMNAKIADKDGNVLGWGLDGEFDPDTTGAAINALSDYYGNDSDVTNAVNSAVKNLSLVQQNDGCYSSWGSESSESIDFIILGLVSVGVDPSGISFTKVENGEKNNLVSALLNFKKAGSDGEFRHILSDSDSNYASTEEALRALIALDEFKNNGGSGYNYYASNIDASKLPVYGQDSDYKAQNGIPLSVAKERDTEVSVDDENTKAVIPSGIFSDYNLTDGYTVSIIKNDLASDYEKNALSKVQSGLNVIGTPFEMELFITTPKGNKIPIDQFKNNPVTMKIKVNPDDLKGIDLSTLKLYYFDGTSWKEVSAAEYDAASSTVTVSTPHFSTFAIMGSLKSTVIPVIQSESGSVTGSCNTVIKNSTLKSLPKTGFIIDTKLLVSIGLLFVGAGCAILFRKKEN